MSLYLHHVLGGVERNLMASPPTWPILGVRGLGEIDSRVTRPVFAHGLYSLLASKPPTLFNNLIQSPTSKFFRRGRDSVTQISTCG